MFEVLFLKKKKWLWVWGDRKSSWFLGRQPTANALTTVDDDNGRSKIEADRRERLFRFWHWSREGGSTENHTIPT